MIVSGAFILALTSLLARDWFFLFAIIGLVSNVRFSVVIRCQLERIISFISWLLSLNFIGMTKGFISCWDVEDSMVCLSSKLMDLISSLISVAL